MQSNRINWIDWAKSICMFFVILGHCHIKDSQILIVQYIYSFHMPLFFMLSGILCKSSFSLTSLKKDIRFLLIPYVVYGSMLILFHSVTSHTYNFFYLYTNILVLLKGYDASVGPIWFLFALFFIKQFFYCCKAILKRHYYIYMFIFVISFFPVVFIRTYNVHLPFFLGSAFCGLPFFLIGNMSKNFLNKEILFLNKRLLFLLIALTFVISSALCYYNGAIDISSCSYGTNIFIFYIDSLLGCSFLILICFLLNNVKFNYVIITSYGTIVTLGLGGYFLSLFHYYIPHFLGYSFQTYNVIIALFFSVMSHYFCYCMIILLDRNLYFPFGLKGNMVNKIIK